MTSKTRRRVALGPHRRPEPSIEEVCHDLRQPAAAILALVAAAQTEAGLPPEVLRRLDQIASEARHISTIVAQASGQGLAFRPVDAGEFAARVVESVRTSTPGTITLVAETGAIIVADAAALRRALGNLMDNAGRAAGAEGSVLVTVGSHGAWVHLDVNDSGPGFGAGPVGFAGLGLEIVEWLATSHGGDLTILKSHLGGTLARLRLPAVRSESAEVSGGRP